MINIDPWTHERAYQGAIHINEYQKFSELRAITISFFSHTRELNLQAAENSNSRWSDYDYKLDIGKVSANSSYKCTLDLSIYFKTSGGSYSIYPDLSMEKQEQVYINPKWEFDLIRPHMDFMKIYDANFSKLYGKDSFYVSNFNPYQFVAFFLINSGLDWILLKKVNRSYKNLKTGLEHDSDIFVRDIPGEIDLISKYKAQF